MSSQLESENSTTETSANPRHRHKSHVVRKRVQRRGRRRLLHLNTVGWVVIDFVAAVTSVVIAFILSPSVSLFPTKEVGPYVTAIPCALSFALILSGMAHIAGLHDRRHRGDSVDTLIRSFTVVCLAMATLSIGWSTLFFLQIGRYVLIFATVACIALMTISRLSVFQWTKRFAQTVGFVGGDLFCSDVAQFVDDHPLPSDVRTITEYSAKSNESIAGWAVDRGIDEVVYESASATVDDSDLLECLDAGVKVTSYSDFIEEHFYFVPVDKIDAKWLFSARLDLAHPYYHGVKRVFDIIASTLGLILTAPLMLVAAILIKLESSGPILYSQIRVGRFNREFRIYKLRTMVTNAESGGARWASTNDARITPVGRFLRKTRLDEIPQFWNVLKGEMSLVGPRPERPEFVEQLAEEIPFYLQRHLVNPGLTGWAQINYPYGASVQDSYNKLTYDLYYIKRSSLALDLQILLRTIGSVMKGSR